MNFSRLPSLEIRVKYWPGQWPDRLDVFRAQVGDCGLRMWELALPLCGDEDEQKVVRYAIELVCGPFLSAPTVPKMEPRATAVKPQRPSPTVRRERIAVKPVEQQARKERHERIASRWGWAGESKPGESRYDGCGAFVLQRQRATVTLDDYDKRAYRNHAKARREYCAPDPIPQKDSRRPKRAYLLYARSWPTLDEVAEVVGWY